MKNSYPEFSITLKGSDLDQARQWLLSLQSSGEIEILRWGKAWTIGGMQHRHLKIRLISGQTSLFPDPSRPKPEPGSMVMGNR